MKWGIIGCGVIAGNFAESLEILDGAELLACGSKTPGKAEKFAGDYKVTKWYEDYESLLADESVEVVYVATTHNFHYENVVQCLEAGKHVLCEKTFTTNALQAMDLQSRAAEKKLFLMEAMWTRFLPATVAMLDLIKSGEIGEVKYVRADLSFVAPKDYSGRIYNRNLAGGALMDVGIYTLSFSSMVFNEAPLSITANGSMTETGVDARSSFLLDYGNGRGAQLSCTISQYGDTGVIIGGTDGWIEVPCFYDAKSFILHKGNKVTTFDRPYAATGKYFEASEVETCIGEGLLESRIWPMSRTVAVMKNMDEIRRQIGLVLPESMEQVI